MKTIIKTTFGLVIILVVLYFSAGFILNKLAIRIENELRPRLEEQGIRINSFSYDNVRLISFRSAGISDVKLNFNLTKKMYGKESFSAMFNAGTIQIRFADFKNPSLFFILKDFVVFIEPHEEGNKRTFGKLQNGYIQTRIPLYLKNPEESAREILQEIQRLFQENETRLDMDLQADVLLGIDNEEVRAGIFTKRIEDVTVLRFDRDDILNAAQKFEIELGEQEAEIIAQNPGKVPAMIKITRDAKRLSAYEKNLDSNFPEEAFRHIYWSYHLTREFGPDLAKEITDAHETVPGNTANKRLMDFHNNEVGQRLAAKQFTVEELKRMVLESDEIIRWPDEVIP